MSIVINIDSLVRSIEISTTLVELNNQQLQPQISQIYDSVLDAVVKSSLDSVQKVSESFCSDSPSVDEIPDSENCEHKHQLHLISTPDVVLNIQHLVDSLKITIA